ncbi:alpha/beta hydrolase [Sporosarcina siberiensis]|uniref:Alpha/beta hydrolase n=1 Tax=Sporosarcina siberiensis TaxID=1365606 RepID=A0ABW4SJA7_9BACL
MRIKKAQSIFIAGNDTAVLLLHSFTSHTRDMNMLAKSIHESFGFTCYAPLYRGHGEEAEALIPYTIDDWWEDTLESYQELAKKYKQVTVIGLSVGGVFALKLAEQFPIEQVIVMSVPMNSQPLELKKRVIDFAFRYKKLENKSDQQIKIELKRFDSMPLDSFERFKQFISETRNELDKITAPIAVYYGGRDEVTYEESAFEIADNVSSKTIQLEKFYNTSHLMTLSKEKDRLFEQIHQFLSPQA